MNSDSQQTEIYYRRLGKGPALVLLHGFPDSGEAWDGVVDELSMHFTLIIPDMPGSGKSELAKPTTIAEMATLLKGVLDKEGIDKAVIAGHSMGGYIALAFARSYPEYVAGLSLVHSSPFADDEEKKKNRLKAIEIIRNGGKEAFVRQMTPNLFTPSFAAENPDEILRKAQKGMEMSDEGMINFYAAMIGRSDSTDIINNAVFPVQWILGCEDNVIFYKSVLKECYRSRVNFVTLYKGCGHMSMIENREALVYDLIEFGNYCNCNPFSQ